MEFGLYLLISFVFYKVYPVYAFAVPNTVLGAAMMALTSGATVYLARQYILAQSLPWIAARLERTNPPPYPRDAMLAFPVSLAVAVGAVYFVGLGFSERFMRSLQHFKGFDPMFFVMAALPPATHLGILAFRLMKTGGPPTHERPPATTRSRAPVHDAPPARSVSALRTFPIPENDLIHQDDRFRYGILFSDRSEAVFDRRTGARAVPTPAMKEQLAAVLVAVEQMRWRTAGARLDARYNIHRAFCLTVWDRNSEVAQLFMSQSPRLAAETFGTMERGDLA